ncbi:MAG: RluA family pseudouridine synthase [Burkholderiaceae bacterium]
MAVTEAPGVEHEEADAGPDAELREFHVSVQQHGQRLDRCLAEVIVEFSRSYLQQLIADGAVELNGMAVLKSATRVKEGDACRIALRATPQSRAFRPEAMDLRVLFADAHLLVIDKPAGLVVHPAPGNWSGTLLNGLLAHDAALAELPRAGIVHRLDKDTSGLMLVARTRSTMDALVRMIAERSVQRQYIALAHRPWFGPAQRDISTAIGRDPVNRLRMAVVDTQRHAGKQARTSVEMLCNGDSGCLLRCTLHTGRTHQIRVHLASVGHPLVGDLTYGGQPAGGLQRQGLHAFRLALAHPVTGVSLELRSALPTDLSEALQGWGFAYGS